MAAAVLIGAIGGSLVGFATTPHERAQAEPRSPATTVGRQRTAHATATLAPPTSRVRPVAVPRTSRHHLPTTTSPPPTSTVRPKRSTTTTTTSTTSTTLPPTSSPTTGSTEGPTTTSSSTETTVGSTETTAGTGPPDPGG